MSLPLSLVGFKVSNEGTMDGRKWGPTDVVARVSDAPLGPPTSWVPPRVSPSPIPLSIASEYHPAHIPLEGEGRIQPGP